jgi:hypothetical protein
LFHHRREGLVIAYGLDSDLGLVLVAEGKNLNLHENGKEMENL